MAGDWIKVEHTTPDKPEVVRLASILGIDQDAVVGKLLRLWIWADQNSVNGNDVSVTDSFLDRLAFCNGFSIALRNVGWLTGKNGCLMLPNFERHNGQTAKSRAVTNRRVAKHRIECNAAIVTHVTPPPLQKALPEKRREEFNPLPPPCNVEEAEAHLRAAAFSGRVRLTHDQIPECAMAYWAGRDADEWRRRSGVPLTKSNWKSDAISFATSYSANHQADAAALAENKDPYRNIEEL